MQMFNLRDESSAEMLTSLEETVNEAILEAIRKSLYRADVTLKISIHLASETDERGNVVLVPEYEFRDGYKLGGKFERGKGKSRGTMGLKLDRAEGSWEPVQLPEQMNMEALG